MLEKKCIPLYLEDLAFIIKRVGWKVTKIHSHLTFEQKRFKKNFILMNQKSRQESKNNVEKNFFKLLNNSNFGYDRRNNMDNCDFVPIFDNIGEVQKIQKYYNLFDPKVAQFLSGELMKDSIEEQYNDQLHKLNKNDPFYQIKLSSLNHKRLAGLEAAKYFDEKKKKQKRKLTLIDYSERISEAHKNTSIKSLIDFDNEYSSSIKAVAIKQSTNVKVTTRFISGKMLMFAKVSIKSFVYDLIDVFMFPDQKNKEIYQKYDIEKCYVYQNLPDTDFIPETSLFFLFICNLKSSMDELKV